MDPTRDNPLIRAKAFVDGLGISTLFFVLLLLAIGSGIFFGWFKKTETPEDVAAEIRYEWKKEIDTAQAASLNDDQIEAAVSTVAQRLIASAPVAVTKPEQLIPGSETARKLAEAPASTLPDIDSLGSAADAQIDPAVMEIGKMQYMVCGACHGANGEGGAAGPPIAQSEWVTGPISNLILIQLRGLVGDITVNGKVYSFPAGMTPMAYQTDEQIAGVLTYIRNSFGNKASPVTPQQVAALRGEVGKPQVNVKELIQP